MIRMIQQQPPPHPPQPLLQHIIEVPPKREFEVRPFVSASFNPSYAADFYWCVNRPVPSLFPPLSPSIPSPARVPWFPHSG